MGEFKIETLKINNKAKVKLTYKGPLAEKKITYVLDDIDAVKERIVSLLDAEVARKRGRCLSYEH